MTPKVGDRAPEFSLRDKDTKVHSLKEFKHDYLVVYFYPKDNTPGCSIEAAKFSSGLNEFHKLNSEVIGISGGDEKSKKRFCEKLNLKLLLLSDPDFRISKKYGVYGEKSFLGKKFNGIKRETFILNRKRKIIKIYDKVKPLIHSGEVLEFISKRKEKE